jgi:hypothetical protein
VVELSLFVASAAPKKVALVREYYESSLYQYCD